MSSKRQSITNPPRSDPTKWVFFTDRDLGKSIPNALRAAGYTAERHDDHFPDTRTKDLVWLPAVAARGWIAFSHNKAIRRVEEERDAAMRAGLALFFLIGKKHEDYHLNLIVTMPAVIAFRERHDPPFIAKIHRPKTQFSIGSRPGRIEMDLTEEQWRAKLGEVE